MAIGSTTENMVYGYLMRKGDDLRESPELNHKYKIDFIVTVLVDLASILRV